MFTGIIEETGVVESFSRQTSGARMRVKAAKALADLRAGDSVAVNGVCITATEVTPESFSADLSPETLERTSLGALAVGMRVNLERPLLPSSRLSGHIVQGHVDAAGEFLSCEPVGDDNWWLRIRVPRELLRYLVFKGSIAIDGISLTIASLDDDVVGVAVIPHTYKETSLGGLRAGSQVNLECDVIAKHVERLLAHMDFTGGRAALTLEELKDQGY